jgi:MoaA/NifB/PqqE/SkfB family radical SAM enzyme
MNDAPESAPPLGSAVRSTGARQAERENWTRLQGDLLEQRLVFEGRPFEAYVQFSTFCNMSCIMCHGDRKPPVERIRPDVLERFRHQVVPTLSLLNPHGGSEPLALGWDDVVEVVHEGGIGLCINTNVQLLDDRRFRQMSVHLDWLRLSVDSHIPELLERIRPGARTEQILGNLGRVARLCREQGIDCGVLIVLLTENAATLPETIAYLCDEGIDQVFVIRLVNTNGHCDLLDPLSHFSAAYIESVKQRCAEVVRQKNACMYWQLDGTESFDHRPARPEHTERRCSDEQMQELLRLRHPGYCFLAHSRIRLNASGNVAPCGYATYGELTLGDLAQQDLDAIWNGVNAQDLRRGMLTGDVPSLCRTCFRHDPTPPRSELPFLRQLGAVSPFPVRELRAELEPVAPDHAWRGEQAPRFAVRAPQRKLDRVWLALSLGGQAEDLQIVPLRRVARRGEVIELELPDGTWERLRTNCGYWWTVLAPVDPEGTVLRTDELRCLIRHQDLPRIPGSTLGYPDLGHRPMSDLGGGRRVGWGSSDESPRGRPALQDREQARSNGRIAPVAPVGRSRGGLSGRALALWRRWLGAPRDPR